MLFVESSGEVVHVGGLILIVHWIFILSLGGVFALAVVHGRIKEEDAVVVLSWTLILVDTLGVIQ